MTFFRWVSSLAKNPFIYMVWQAPFKREKINPLLEDPDWRGAQRILDLGCGPGTNTSLFQGKDYLGVDCDKRMIQKASATHGNKFLLGDVTRGKFVNKGPFDLVLVNSILHHLDDESVRSTLAYVKKSLAPLGRVYLFDLVLPKSHGLPRFFAKIDRGHYPRGLSRWQKTFREFFSEIEFRSYDLHLAGVRLYQMVYFKGSARPPDRQLDVPAQSNRPS